MKAIQVSGEGLVWADFDRPQCGPGELRIQVVASMVHYGDYRVSGLKQYLHEQGLKIRMSW